MAVNERVLDFIGDPVEMDGEVERIDDMLFFRIDPARIRRL